jgi:hypothetical protein
MTTFPAVETTPTWNTYLDMANDVKPFLQWPNSTTPQDQLLQNTVDDACAWVQETIGGPVAPTMFQRRFNGYSNWGGSTISLPYFPVIVDTSHPITVTEFWGLSGPHTLTLQTPSAQGGSDMFSLDALEGNITRSYLGLLARPTFPGLKNIEVTWWAGYNPLPPVLRRVTLRLIKHWWSKDMQSQVGGGGFKRSEGDGYEHQYIPFLPDGIMEILGPYIHIGVA